MIGKITDKTIRRGKSTSYMLSYLYADQHNRLHLRETTVYKSEFEDAWTGQPVLVFYDPANASRSIVYQYSQYAVRHGCGGALAG